MESASNSLKSKQVNPEQLIRALSAHANKFLNAFDAQACRLKTHNPALLLLAIPDLVWADMEHRVPDIDPGLCRRGRPFLSKRLVASAILTMVYFQETPNLFLGNKTISASAVRKYLKIWRRRRVFKKIRGIKLPEQIPLTPIDWRWLKYIEHFTAI